MEFEAYVLGNAPLSPYTENIINVNETDVISEEHDTFGWGIRIGMRTLLPDIDESVERGDHVIVRGKVSAKWTEYYDIIIFGKNINFLCPCAIAEDR